MSDKTIVLITGANQGLGYYAAQSLGATGGYHVLIGSRDIGKANKAIETIVADKSHANSTESFSPLQIDVTDDQSIAAAVATVSQKFGKLDCLLNNAGIALAQEASTGPELRELYQRHYDTNVFGAMCVTEAFLALLRKGEGKRLSFTSSGLGSCTWHAEGQYAGMYPIYRSTKSALNALMVHYAQVLQEEGFIVGANDPGYCATNLNNNQGFLDPREGAKMLIQSAFGSKEEVHCVVLGSGGKEPF